MGLPFDESLIAWSKLSPEDLLPVFVPPLIFYASQTIQFRVLQRTFMTSIFLALLKFLAFIPVIATILHVFMPYRFSWDVVFLFGVMLTATDQDMVLALLEEDRAFENLSKIIEVASFISDGLRTVLLHLVLSFLSGELFTYRSVFTRMIRTCLGGIAVGFVFGVFFVLLDRFLFKRRLQPTIVFAIVATYFAYAIAEIIFDVTGVLAIMTLGIIFATHIIEPESQTQMISKQIWELISRLATTFITVWSGIVVTVRVMQQWQYFDAKDLYYIGLLYFVIQALQFVVVKCFSYALHHHQLSISRHEGRILAMCEFEGATSFSLVLSVLVIHRTNAHDYGRLILERETAAKFVILAGVAILGSILNGYAIPLSVRLIKACFSSNANSERQHIRVNDDRQL